MSFAQFGNDLYTGRRQIQFVRRQKVWYAVSVVILILAAVGIFGRGLNFGLEFRGGSEYRVPNVTNTQNYDVRAKQAVSGDVAGANVVVTKLGQSTVRLETEQLTKQERQQVAADLAKEFHVKQDTVSTSLVGASWGQTVTNKALWALGWFLGLVTLVLAIYFRTWKMAVAALVALLHDLVITVGIYALFGFEITPASMIGFLTILGYSLYDTVVVFDKVRENTSAALANGRLTYSQAANIAVNQTLVRSINTSVVALLPVASILVVGFTLLGAGTLLDLSLALFVGIAAGTYSSIFIATPLLADLREREPRMKALAKRAAKYQAKYGVEHPVAADQLDEAGRTPAEAAAVADDGAAEGAVDDTAPAGQGGNRPAGGASPGNGQSADSGTGHVGGRPLHPYAQGGPRNQPRRKSRSRR
ncbi:MAG TPA: protein translocase subunit SecF [Segeticoccus sp.]|uniref:protein translocase subunit SecF n=1 Tax=Segeticoccus sp. TaxID=2706531 RepID=UPI002D80F24F|nr:protein translocase subunit SecF [Segeticoccus sp.]HET8599642.1 protein translocase subunit SecF [Segeticoccus sp.]